MPDFKTKMHQIQFRLGELTEKRGRGGGVKGEKRKKEERSGGRESEGPQALVHTPMFEILKNTSLSFYLKHRIYEMSAVSAADYIR